MGNATDMLTHVLHTHYSAPQGFDWEEYAQQVDDNSVGSRATQLVNSLKGRAAAYRHRHLLVPFGDDFKFRNAELQFSNMGRLVRYIQQHSAMLGNVWIRFSTLSDYFQAAADEGQFPSLQGDFMPYADNEQSYWTVQQSTTLSTDSDNLHSRGSQPLIAYLCVSARPPLIVAGLLHHPSAAEGQVEGVSNIHSSLLIAILSCLFCRSSIVLCVLCSSAGGMCMVLSV